MVRGSSPKRPETAPPGKGAGRRKIGVGRGGPQARYGIGDIGGRHSLRRQPCPHRAHQLAAAMQRLYPRGGISRVVEQPRFTVARDKPLIIAPAADTASGARRRTRLISTRRRFSVELA